MIQPQPYSSLDASLWNGLDPAAGPFTDWRFLASAEEAGCTGGGSGWLPLPLLEGDQEVAADGSGVQVGAPAWLKLHSRGEFVFDFVWARAAAEAGLPWYPKLLVAAPFTPVPGPRLLGATRHPEAALKLIQRMEELVEDQALSSAAVNFCSPEDARLLRQAGWLERHDWQFHWHNPGYANFEEFLAALRHKPRKNIRAERRKVRQAGWSFRFRHGDELSAEELDLVHRCHRSTFATYGNPGALNHRFFELLAARLGPQFLVCIARLEQQDLACAIFLRDERRLYGRYWGSLVETRDVHFETSYYQGMDYCMEHGLEWFEPGAQGEHKIPRGFLPQTTRSFHYIRHLGLRHGIARWLEGERQALQQYRQALERLDPFPRA